MITRILVLLTIFACLVDAVAQGLFFRRKEPGSVSSGITVDLWQTFEGTTPDTNSLSANDGTSLGLWLTNDTAGLITFVQDDKSLGGLLVNGTTDTGHTNAMQRTSGSASAASVAFDLQTANSKPAWSIRYWWKYQGTFGANRRLNKVFGTASGAFPRLDITYNTKYVQFSGLVNSNASALASNTWYLITAKYTSNGTCYARAYDTNLVQVGQEITDTGHNSNPRYLHVPSDAVETTESTVKFFYDDIMIDWTDATYPLLP